MREISLSVFMSLKLTTAQFAKSDQGDCIQLPRLRRSMTRTRKYWQHLKTDSSPGGPNKECTDVPKMNSYHSMNIAIRWQWQPRRRWPPSRGWAELRSSDLARGWRLANRRLSADGGNVSIYRRGLSFARWCQEYTFVQLVQRRSLCKKFKISNDSFPM